MDSYTRKVLLANERIIYSGRIHFFCYMPSVIIILIGMFLFGIIIPPSLPENIENENIQQMKHTMDQLEVTARTKIDGVKKEAASFIEGLPEELQMLITFVSQMRAVYFGMIFMFIGFVNLTKNYLKKHTSEFVVTNKKVIYKFGVMAVDSQELNLERVEAVKVKQGVIDRLVGRGDVLVNGVGIDQIYMKKIARPEEFRKAVLRAIEHYVDNAKR